LSSFEIRLRRQTAKQSDVIVQKQFILYKSVRVVVDMLAALTNHHHEKLLLDPAAARLSRQASFFSFFAAARVGFAFDCENVPHSEQRISAKGRHQQILYSAPSLCGTFCLNTRTLHPPPLRTSDVFTSVQALVQEGDWLVRGTFIN